MKKLITIIILLITLDSFGQQFADTTALKTYINDSIPQNFFTHDRTRQLRNAILSTINFTGGGGGGGGGTVTSVAAGFGTNFTTITGTGSVIVDSTSGGVLSWRRGAKLMDSLNTVNLTGNGTANYIPYYSSARVLTSNVRFQIAPSTNTLLLRGLTATDNALVINTFNDAANSFIFKTNGVASLGLPAGTDVGIGVTASGTSGAKLIVKGDATNTAGAFFRGNADANVAFGINTANDASNRHLFYSDGSARMAIGAGTVSIRTGAAGTAWLHLGAGTSSASTAPLKFTSGTNTTTAEAGAVEYNDNFYATKVNAVRYGLGGSLNVNTTDVGNVGTGADNLMTYSVPAGTLSNNGDYIEFSFTFTFATNANNKTVKVVYGATEIYTSTAQPQNDGSMEVKGKIIRTGATTQKVIVTATTDGTLFTDLANYTTAAETLSGAVTLKATGEATSDNDIINRILVVKYFPNN